MGIALRQPRRDLNFKVGQRIAILQYVRVLLNQILQSVNRLLSMTLYYFYALQAQKAAHILLFLRTEAIPKVSGIPLGAFGRLFVARYRFESR